jgi:hypothetical protein
LGFVQQSLDHPELLWGRLALFDVAVVALLDLEASRDDAWASAKAVAILAYSRTEIQLEAELCGFHRQGSVSLYKPRPSVKRESCIPFLERSR